MIPSKRAIHNLTQLHAELAGKIKTNREIGDKLRTQMMQVEAVIKTLRPDFTIKGDGAIGRQDAHAEPKQELGVHVAILCDRRGARWRG
jgi:hypothetical protein